MGKSKELAQLNFTTDKVGINLGNDVPQDTLHVRTYGNSEISTQYGTGLKAKIGAYANSTQAALPSASVDFSVSGETGATDTLNLRSYYNNTWYYGLRMDPQGRLTTPKQPFFDGNFTNTGSQTAGTKLTMAQYTNSGITLGTNNTRLTVPSEGYYFVTASYLAQPASGYYGYFTVLTNGTARYHSHNNFYSETNKDFHISKVMHLGANDYIEFSWIHQGIDNSWAGLHCTVSVYKLG